MKERMIAIDEQGIVIFPDYGMVWMTEYEIAHLFQVFNSAIIANRKAIFKSGVLCKEDVCKVVEVPKGYLELYNLEMIMALAFRIKSYRTEILREWLMKKALRKDIPEMLIMAIKNPILN